MLKNLRKREGFTLVEVLVVVVILAILAAIAVPIYLRYVEGARSAEAQEAISAIYAAAKVFQAKTGTWPSNVRQLEVQNLQLDQVTRDRWNFQIVSGGSTGVTSISATSTGRMPGGAGKIVKFTVADGKWSGYGID
jgi:prepilin-type N-terminal cleavage/methylation domain-containing protein